MEPVLYGIGALPHNKAVEPSLEALKFLEFYLVFLDIKFPYLKQGLVSWVWCSRDCRVCQGQGFHICGEITCTLGVCPSDIVLYLFCCPYLLVWSMLTIVIKDETLKCWFSSFKPQSLALPLLLFAVPSSSTVSLHVPCHCGSIRGVSPLLPSMLGGMLGLVD